MERWPSGLRRTLGKRVKLIAFAGSNPVLSASIYMNTILQIKDIDRIIEMAWEDRTPFEAIEYQFGLKENGVRKIMRDTLKRSSFKLWRERVKGRKTKHLITSKSTRFKSKNQ